jgi:hypothetical protein
MLVIKYSSPLRKVAVKVPLPENLHSVQVKVVSSALATAGATRMAAVSNNAAAADRCVNANIAAPSPENPLMRAGS